MKEIIDAFFTPTPGVSGWILTLLLRVGAFLFQFGWGLGMSVNAIQVLRLQPNRRRLGVGLMCFSLGIHAVNFVTALMIAGDRPELANPAGLIVSIVRITSPCIWWLCFEPHLLRGKARILPCPQRARHRSATGRVATAIALVSRKEN